MSKKIKPNIKNKNERNGMSIWTSVYLIINKTY